MSLPQTLHLKQLFAHSPEDTAQLQDTLEAVPLFWNLTQGTPCAPNAAVQTLDDLPPGKSLKDKHVLCILSGSNPIGCVDLVRGWPNLHTAMLGLLVLAETHQDQGLGAQSYRLIEEYASRWAGITRIRIGVIALNEKALRFWKKLGFTETGERKTHHEGIIRSEVIVLEKPISR